ncbi:MAG: hypothetical protein M1570_00805 [Chloroflexi bacterium]|nr:hypothetical protein [Chloroflexota bacterium]
MFATVVLPTLLLFVATACASTSTGAFTPSGAATLAPTATPVPPKPLTVTPAHAPVGTRVTAAADGLPPGATVNLTWKTVDGGWVIKDYYHFGGKKFSDTSQSLSQARVDSNGRLSTQFTIPEDYGGIHDVIASVNGTPVAQGGVEVTASFEMTPSEGPVGSIIEISAKGLGWRTMESTWVMNWDDREVGWISAVNTRGSAVARVRAAGPVGEHIVKIYTGYMGQSYLNYEQAPTSYLPRPQFVFHTLPGGQVASAYAEPYPTQPVQASSSPIGARLALSPTQGPVGTVARLAGSGLPANETLAVTWETWVGSRVTQEGFTSTEKTLSPVAVSADGTLDASVTIPDDLGGQHALVLSANNKEVARANFAVETSIVSLSPTSGPAGTDVTIHLKGVGWTEYDNIYVATYDNAYMGYACGFNSQGDVVIHFTASGAAGTHLIDLYPGIYEGPADGQQLYRLPQLTYADDHPGNKIPALRFAFQISQ